MRSTTALVCGQEMVAYRKLTAIGDGGCGKTSLLTVFQTGKFVSTYVPTVFDTCTVQGVHNGKKVDLSLWDTAGQEDYSRLRPLSYAGTDVALVCFSVDSLASFENLKTIWIPELRHYCPHTPFIVVGTKKDLRKKVKDTSANYNLVPRELAAETARLLGAVAYMECSALEDEGVVNLFTFALQVAMELKRKPASSKCFIL